MKIENNNSGYTNYFYIRLVDDESFQRDL